MTTTGLQDPEFDVDDDVVAAFDAQVADPQSASRAMRATAADAIDKVVSKNPIEFLRQHRQLDGE
jgi:hypothetical protein